MMLGLLYRLRRADVLLPEFEIVGLGVPLPEGTSSSKMSEAGDINGLQPKLERLDPPGLGSSDDV